MKRFLVSGWPLAFLLSLALVATVHQGTLSRVPESSDDELPTIARVRDLIVDHWVEEPTLERRARMRYGAVEGMASQLDPYSEFIPPEKKERFDIETNGEFGGLGVLIAIDKGQLVIVAPYEDTPAWEAGILPGDRVLEINGQRHEFQTEEEAKPKLRGPIGTPVELLVENPGLRPEAVRLTITRAVIKMQSVKGARVVAPGVGYLAITSFQEPTVEEFDRAVARLTSEGITALVVDLRGNPGGLLGKATELAGRFLEKDSVVVITRGRGDTNEQKTLAAAPKEAPVLRMPIALLMDSGSASASEVLAGALRDNKKATLVGTRSFGKGSVQSLFPIDDGKAKLKLTTHYYFTPSARRIHRLEHSTEKDEWGLIPDIVVPLEAKARQELIRQENELDLEVLKMKRDPRIAPSDPTKLLPDPQREAAIEHVQKVLRHEATLAVPQVATLRATVASPDSAATPSSGATKNRVRSPGGG